MRRSVVLLGRSSLMHAQSIVGRPVPQSTIASTRVVDLGAISPPAWASLSILIPSGSGDGPTLFHLGQYFFQLVAQAV